jgi:tetratricopeptide (TPR) repeat protein
MLIGAPIATAAVVALVVLWQSQRTPALTERDTVVLADFRNRTGDTMFDDTLNEALAVQLRQSPYLNLLPEQQVQSTLRQMGREPMAALTPEVTGEICQRNGAKAMLGGTIAAIGNQYLLTLSAQDCVSGAILAEEQVTADGKDNVITALGRSVSAFREKLGESLASVQRYDQNIEMATTTSLEALKAYSQGMTTRRTQGDFESLPFFRRAVDLDPKFALAHARLGTVLSNLGELSEAETATRRSYELREKASDRERWYIEARYYTTVTRDQNRAIEAYRLLLATYPDDYAAHSNLGGLYRAIGQNKDALRHLEEAVRLAPMQPLGHLNLGGAYFDDGRYAEAQREWEEVLKLQEHLGARLSLVRLATVMGNEELAARHMAAAKSPRGEIDIIGTRMDIAVYRGQFNEVARLADELFRMLEEQERLSQAAEGVISLAIVQATTGRVDDARATRSRLLKSNALSDGAWDEMVALAALLGERDVIDEYLERTIKRTQSVSRPEDHIKIDRALRALAAFGYGRYEEAYDLSVANGFDLTQRTGVLLAGLSALRLQRWDDAVKALDAYIAFGPRLGPTSYHAVARIMLARAHAGAGRLSDARKHYEDAFRIWNEADPDLPLLVEARREYERLSS